MQDPLVRIVTMTFKADRTADFLKLFADIENVIRSFPGCQHLELLRDRDDASVFTTYSVWESAEQLDAYRSSQLFETTWTEARGMFADRPRAHSYRLVTDHDLSPSE